MPNWVFCVLIRQTNLLIAVVSSHLGGKCRAWTDAPPQHLRCPEMKREASSPVWAGRGMTRSHASHLQMQSEPLYRNPISCDQHKQNRELLLYIFIDPGFIFLVIKKNGSLREGSLSPAIRPYLDFGSSHAAPSTPTTIATHSPTHYCQQIYEIREQRLTPGLRFLPMDSSGREAANTVASSPFKDRVLFYWLLYISSLSL